MKVDNFEFRGCALGRTYFTRIYRWDGKLGEYLPAASCTPVAWIKQTMMFCLASLGLFLCLGQEHLTDCIKKIQRSGMPLCPIGERYRKPRVRIRRNTPAIVVYLPTEKLASIDEGPGTAKPSETAGGLSVSAY